MSSTKMEKSRSKTHLLKTDVEEECVSNTGKPCIDFQPDDRWHIEEDHKDEEQQNNNSRPRRSNRKRKGGVQRSTRAKKPATAVNGEVVMADPEENDIDHDDSASKSKDSVELSVESQVGEATAENNSKDIAVLNSKSLPSKQENCHSAIKKEVSSPLTEANGVDDVISNCAESTVKESEASSVKPEKSDCSNDSVSNENKDSCSAPVLKDERTETTNTDGTKTDTSAEVSREQTMPELSSNENSQSSLKKDEGDVAIIEDKLSNTNSDAGESDSEVQIISESDKDSAKECAAEDKLIEQSFAKDKSLPEEERKLSPGYIYFNSLQEKMPDFVAGKYKPVKFPHTGTLMLEENEVIIESPSLLVPLLIKEADRFPKLDEGSADSTSKPKAVRRNFFQSSVGEFLINLGGSRVLEWHYKDLRRAKLKQLRKSPSNELLQTAVSDCQKDLTLFKSANNPFNFPLQKCKFCDFKTESSLVLEGHYLIPHITSRREYKCNFCDFLCRDPREMAFHFEAIHGKRVVSGDQASYFECLFCSFHSNLKSKLKVHMNRCRKYFLPSQNQSPPFDFEFPGVTTKPVTIADVIAHRRMLMGSTKAPYSNQAQSNMDMNMTSALARKKLQSVLGLTGSDTFPDSPTLIKHLIGSSAKPGTTGFQLPPNIVLTRPRVRAQQVRQPSNMSARMPGLRGSNPRNPAPFPAVLTSSASHLASSGISITPINKQDPSSARMTVGSQGSMKNITLTPISSAGNLVSQKPGPPQPIALFTNVAGSEMSKARAGMLPLSQSGRMQMPPGGRASRMMAPYQRLNTPPSQVVKTGSGSSFVLCEICDSYIKDLEELRSHMNWVHKVKIHPKMLVSRPPLNCQKCQWRFFTDQGLERHLLGAHGLVTTNMQEMANKNQDGGRCIICGAVFTYKLVSHMTQVHKVTLKPAHLSYKCTVCTATFTLYRLFESHVYNVHSSSAKRPAEEPAVAAVEPPAKKAALSPEEPKPEPLSSKKCSDCGEVVDNMEKHIIQNHLKECRVKLCRIEKCEKCLYSSNEMLVIRMSDFKALRGSDEDSSDEDNEDDSDASSEASQEEDDATENKADDSKDGEAADV